MRHFNIPFFISQLGCPHQCVFCDQRRISGVPAAPAPEEISRRVAAHLASFPEVDRRVEIAFFGGNFTGLPRQEQEAYLHAAAPWLRDSAVHGIRVSTRPDYIDRENLAVLKHHGVSAIELGAQSFDDDVLRLSDRGHTVRQVEESSHMILDAGFVLGLQMMTGLPGDSMESTTYTAQRIVELGAAETRIYPVLVIRGTRLEKMYRDGRYRPLDLDDAVERCKRLVLFFERHGVTILRLGLHPSEGLLSGGELAAGPFHPALGQLVATAIWKDRLREAVSPEKGTRLTVSVAPGELNAAIGHNAVNRKWLLQHFATVTFRADPQLEGRTFHADYR